MMYCVNCEFPVSREEVDNRKCKNGGNDPAHEAPKLHHSKSRQCRSRSSRSVVLLPNNDIGKQVAAYQPAISKTVFGNSASPHC